MNSALELRPGRGAVGSLQRFDLRPAAHFSAQRREIHIGGQKHDRDHDCQGRIDLADAPEITGKGVKNTARSGEKAGETTEVTSFGEVVLLWTSGLFHT